MAPTDNGWDSNYATLFDPEDFSAVRPSDVDEYEFGKPSPYADRAAEINIQRQKLNDNAMEMLRNSLSKSAEVSPSQGLAAALLGIIPTVGGYLIGKSVGNPNIPEGAIGFDATKYQTGAYAGGLAGAQLGDKTTQNYFNSLEANQAQKNKVQEQMASVLLNESARLGTREESLIQAGLNQDEMNKRQEDNQANQREIAKIYAQNRGKSPEEMELSKLRLDIARDEANRRAQNQNFNQGKSTVPGFKNVSGAVLNPTTVIEIGRKREGLSQVNQLLSQYIANPGSIVGQESAMDSAISGLLMNAERLRTNSGANFTNTEQNLIARATPQIAAGNLLGWLKQEALGRDQKQFAKDLMSLHQKTSDYSLADTYGLIREDVPSNYYPPAILQKWGINPPSAPTSKIVQDSQGNSWEIQYDASGKPIGKRRK